MGAIAVTAVIAGCTNDSFEDFGGGFATAGSVSSSASSSGDSGDFTPVSACDGIRIGQACYALTPTGGSVTCEIGTSANSACNPFLTCTNGHWEQVDTTPARTPSQCAFTCPSAFTEVGPPGICDGPTAIATICEFPEGTCGCAPVDGVDTSCPAIHDPGDAGGEGGTSDGGDAGVTSAGDAGTKKYEWRCVKPRPTDADAGVKCPHVRPREGRECVVRGLPDCDYGFADFEDGVRMGCDTNGWVSDLARSKQCEQ